MQEKICKEPDFKKLTPLIYTTTSITLGSVKKWWSTPLRDTAAL